MELHHYILLAAVLSISFWVCIVIYKEVRRKHEQRMLDNGFKMKKGPERPLNR